ncbi:PDZ domain-containing protein [Paenibacillus nasutitermitis]|uniref:PDZ domain-containing protein n=1 Tax=Paenibacillus nasutitermitis TaxID=1652958 RepID=A0A917DPY6_9BACL|nr:PDZ domain-containing protein [Paenibacillus nasutitermitis]GGD57870.1 hypothetical protein GCM10010911_14580 [Paenibacillus nasutitermitis]
MRADKIGKRLYIAGYGLAAILSVAGELIWLGDPVRSGDIYWIDRIQSLIYLLAFVPLLWLCGAAVGIAAERRGSRRLILLRLLVAAGSVTSGVAIFQIPDHLVLSLLLLVITLLLTLVDGIVSERRIGSRWILRSSFMLLVLLVIAAGLFWPTPYGVTSPGFTLNMNRYAQVEEGIPKGSIEGVLVIERPAFPIDWLYAALLPSVHIEKRDTSISIGDMQIAANNQRADANQVSSAVAFQKLGIGRGVIPTGVQIMLIMEDSPAEGKLQPGDQILAANGHAVMSAAELAEEMKNVRPGEEVEVKVMRSGEEPVIKVKTMSSGEEPDRAVFGLQVENRVKADLPKKVGFRSYLVYQGGPSHGAILALTLINQLTPGDITYGNSVAGTGTLEADGSVGPIGGIEQKAYAVNKTDADVFFVPAGQEEDARKGAPNLNIVPVRTLDEMLEWLKAHPRT